MTAGARRFARWVVAIAIIAVGLELSLTGRWRSCDDQIARTGSKAVVRVCQAPQIDDGPVIGGLLLVFLLIWPDLAELGLPGGISIKRRLERSEAALETQRERTELLAERLAFVQSQQQVAVSSARAQTILVLGDPKETLAQLPAKARVFGEELGISIEGAPVVGAERDSESPRVEEGELEREIVRLWREIGARVRRAEEVEAYLQGATSPSPLVSQLIESAGLAGAQQLIRWRELFREEIEIVQAARGAVLADQPLSTGDLSAAVAIARRLLELPVPEE